jgi:hypothetical protein
MADQTLRETVRCAGQTKGGTRCKLNTTKYAAMCHLHTKQQKGLKVIESKIQGAGQGLFAHKDLPRNTKVPYARAQDFLSKQQLDARYGDGLAQYALCNPSETVCTDARSTQSGLSRYANHRPARRNSKLTIGRRNGRRFANLVLTKPVRAGGEVYTDYGPEYVI